MLAAMDFKDSRKESFIESVCVGGREAGIGDYYDRSRFRKSNNYIFIICWPSILTFCAFHRVKAGLIFLFLLHLSFGNKTKRH